MTTDTFQRKLTAILSADVVGYSRLMGEDEEATVRILNKYKEIIFDLIERHNGRLVDSPGDNVLTEFVSVVDAVRCGVRVQEDLKASNEQLPADSKMEFRIGINIGDVIQDGDRIYGDGVNIAARIESFADPGGICISRTAYDQVKGKIDIDYEYLGEYEVKNIKEPIRVYKIQKEKSEVKIATESKTSTLSEKPSIVVLPFVNMSNDPEQEYFSDGMSEELINALAKLEGLKVISRTSAFYFKGESTDLRTIGEKLGVENVLEGSVRKAGNKLRITAQLIKVADDTHLWSEAYNRELEDVFAIQEEISNAIVDSLKIRLLGKEKESIVRTYTENIDAYDAYIKGRYFFYSFVEGSMEKALQYYKQAIQLDPGYAPAHSAIGEYYYARPISGQNISPDDTYTKAIEAVNTALKIDNSLPEAHATLGTIRFLYEWDFKGAEKALKTAIELKPGLSKPHFDYAAFLGTTGNTDRAILEARKGMEIDPLCGLTHYVLGQSFFYSGKFDQALVKLQEAREIIPTFFLGFAFLIWTYSRKGMLREAMDEINKGLEIFPDDPRLVCLKGRIYAQKGEKHRTQKILDELHKMSKKEYVNPSIFAALYTDLEEMDKAMEYLEEVHKRHDYFIFLFQNEYRSDPRFDAFLKKVGL